ncbi:MAG: acyl-CoA mutase large subunit family protein, partial [Syntrophales bacterium]|nr:acyl-CoA mutase large subunit family protein [Syntrophales bacterium]
EGDVASYVNTIDLPTQRGLDPDDPAARGRVGECGMSISTTHDYEALLDGVPLEKALVIIIGFDNVIPLLSLYAAYVLDTRKDDLSKTFHICCNLFHHQWFWDSAAFPPRTAMKLQVELIKWFTKNCPRSYPGVIDGYNVAEAGAPPVLEVAFNLANTIELMNHCIKAGLDPDEVASRIWGHPHISMKFYEEIAKFRASRRLWAKIMKERFGCSKPEALTYKAMVAQTGGSELPAIEVHNNIIRCTIMAMAGMLGDVEGMWISSFDEALGIPAEEAAQVAVRTYQILGEETDIPYVTDPFGGSYFMECLTNNIEEEVLKLLKKMDDMGGYLKCWESGWIRGEVERGGNERLRKIDKGEWVKVGLNKYRVEEVSPVRAFRCSEEAEKKAVARVKQYRTDRDQEKTKKALSKVREAAERIEKSWPESCGELFNACVEAARAKATAGEMHRILREVFGYGYYSG